MGYEWVYQVSLEECVMHGVCLPDLGVLLGGVLGDRVSRGTIALSTLFVVRIFGYLGSIRSLMSAISSCLSHTCTRFGQVTRAVTCDRWSIWMSSLVRFCLDIEMLNGSGASSGFLE